MRYLFFSASIAIFLSWIALARTNGFSEKVIRAPWVKKSAQEPSSNIQTILSQKFYYLSQGRQCFVFESEDGKYVIKFFNHRYLTMPWYAFLCYEKEKKKRTERTFFYENSYEIAFKEFGEEILYLHLGPSQKLSKIQIQDRTSRIFSIDLNQMPFVLQKKGEPFYEKLLQYYQKEGIDSLYRQIQIFQSAILNRIEKGIADADSDVEHNWGFVDGKLVHLDPGRLFYDANLIDSDRRAEEWKRATRKFYKWLKKNVPEIKSFL